MTLTAINSVSTINPNVMTPIAPSPPMSLVDSIQQNNYQTPGVVGEGQLLAQRGGDRSYSPVSNRPGWNEVNRDTSSPDMRTSIKIQVRELQGAELGRLQGLTGEGLQGELDRAAFQINAENKQKYGFTTNALREKAKALTYTIGGGPAVSYYGSPAHQAWAAAAEARTGGRVPADWWMRNDPFGGTNGNSYDVVAGGVYPAAPSRIGMAHDTDWALGRVFGAGPMSDLATSSNPGGMRGLNDGWTNGSNYSLGQKDWNVQYQFHGGTLRRFN